LRLSLPFSLYPLTFVLDGQPRDRITRQCAVRRLQEEHPRYAAARLWVDAIIDPTETRDALIWALEAAALNPEVREFKTGVLQT